MSTTVVPIRESVTVAPGVGEVNAEVVTDLEKMLEQARSGEVTGFVIARLHPGDTTSWTWAGRKTRGLLGAFLLCILQIGIADIEEK